MPYIDKNERLEFDKLIVDIVDKLNELNEEDMDQPFCGNDQLCGQLNYIIFRIAKRLCDPTYDGSRRYARMNTIVGAIESAKAEFQRRIVNPYEDEKIQENGDVV